MLSYKNFTEHRSIQFGMTVFSLSSADLETAAAGLYANLMVLDIN